MYHALAYLDVFTLLITLNLAAYEFFVFYYWVDLKLGQVLLYGGVLAIINLFTGKHALSSIAKRRLNKN